jgi:hypothetical protein
LVVRSPAWRDEGDLSAFWKIVDYTFDFPRNSLLFEKKICQLLRRSAPIIDLSFVFVPASLGVSQVNLQKPFLMPQNTKVFILFLFHPLLPSI